MKNRNYDDFLKEELQDQELARLYLIEALSDVDESVFYQALKDVVRAQGVKIKDLATATNLNRESLYKMLSPKGNPQFSSIKPILYELGFNLTLETVKR